MSVASSNTSAPASPSVKYNNDETPDEQREMFDIESITQQANMTIVIHPGSSHLRIGRASDPQPVMIPHVIAWRHKKPGNQITDRMKLLRQHDSPDTGELCKLDDVLFFHSGRHKSTLNEVSKDNKKKKPEKLQEGCGWTWTDTTHAPAFLIGDDALYIDEKDSYDLFWPIVNGQLNVNEKSLMTILAYLEALWTKAIENFLRIPIKDMNNYRCILVIPDIYIRDHVKSLVHMLLVHMKFSSIIVHQESVCATYGCGIANACVVDVGHQKTSVSCVEDGYSHHDTRLCMDIGGCDITSTFAWLLKRNCFPYRTCDTADRMDSLLLEELKETFCHLDMERVGPEPQEFSLRRPGQMSLLYPITLGDEALQAPMSIFYPKLYGLKCQTSCIHIATKNSGDFEDPFDETYLASTRTKQEEAWATKREKAAAKADVKMETNDSTTEDLPGEAKKKSSKSESTLSELIGLDKAIVWSIENCPDSYEDEVKRRMYNCILVVGGGFANFPGAREFLTKRVKDSIPTSSSNMADQVNIVVKPKGLDPSVIAWKGGTVLSSLDNAQELWIKRQEWIEHGLRLLRECCPFIW